MRTARLMIPATTPLPWHIMFSLTLCLFALMAAAPVRGAMAPALPGFGGTTGTCALTLQLQDPELRARYAARIASAVGSFWASASTASIDAQVQSDAPSDLASILFGSTTPSAGTPGDLTIDSFSRDCLSCHDGMTAVEVDYNYRDEPGRHRTSSFNGSKDHPNGMDYGRYVASSRGDFKPVGTFNTQMVFVDGKVGCLTCHNPMNPAPGHLVMSDRNSALCRTCHDR